MIRAVLVSTLLLSPAAGAVAAEQPSQPAAPMVVTSDTDAYCHSLLRQIGQHNEPLPRTVALLRDQGRHLCDDGQIRGGINRLRRALMALQDPDGVAVDNETGGEDGR